MTEASEHVVETERHRTFYLEAGPPDGPLIVFVHGWPALAISWAPQLAHFAALGYRCIAPDMRGYGGSSAPPRREDYALEEIVADMLELLRALGVGRPRLGRSGRLGDRAPSSARVSRRRERVRGVRTRRFRAVDADPDGRSQRVPHARVSGRSMGLHAVLPV
jgi:hypothetical protein